MRKPKAASCQCNLHKHRVIISNSKAPASKPRACQSGVSVTRLLAIACWTHVNAVQAGFSQLILACQHCAGEGGRISLWLPHEQDTTFHPQDAA